MGDRMKMKTNFSDLARKKRRALDMRQTEVSKGMGVGQNIIWSYENKNNNPNLVTIIRMAAAMNITPAELLEGLEWEEVINE